MENRGQDRSFKLVKKKILEKFSPKFKDAFKPLERDIVKIKRLAKLEKKIYNRMTNRTSHVCDVYLGAVHFCRLHGCSLPDYYWFFSVGNI